jgi:hypothetical protein
MTRLRAAGGLALAVLAAACGAGAPRSGTQPTSERAAAPSTTGSAGPRAGAALGPAAGRPANGPGTAGQGAQPTSASSPPTAPSAAGTTAPASVEAARAALGSYLSALAAHDPREALAASTGAAAVLAAVRATIASVNAASGGSTATTLGPESFAATTASPTEVVFSGSVTVADTVSGPKGTTRSQAVVSGPVVVRRLGATFRVATFDYDGAPMVEVPEGATSVQGSVALTVGSVLSYGQTTAALVGLAARSGHLDLVLERAELVTTAGSEAGQGEFTPAAEPVGFLRFARTSGLPEILDATFRTGSGGTLRFSVRLDGRPERDG